MNGDAGAAGSYTHLAIPPGYLVEGVDQQGDQLQFGNLNRLGAITTRTVPGLVLNGSSTPAGRSRSLRRTAGAAGG